MVNSNNLNYYNNYQYNHNQNENNNDEAIDSSQNNHENELDYIKEQFCKILHISCESSFDEIKNRFIEIQNLPTNQIDSEEREEQLWNLGCLAAIEFRGERFKLLMQACRANPSERDFFLTAISAYDETWGNDTNAHQLNLDEIEEEYHRIDKLSENEINESEREVLIEHLIYAAAQNIMGKRHEFLKKATKVKEKRVLFFRKVLEAHFDLLINQAKNYRVPIWKIQNTKTGAVGFLCGTQHSLPQIDFEHSAIPYLLKKCSFLAVELNPYDPEIYGKINRNSKTRAIYKFDEKAEATFVKNQQKRMNKTHPDISFISDQSSFIKTGKKCVKIVFFDGDLVNFGQQNKLNIHSLETVEAQEEAFNIDQKRMPKFFIKSLNIYDITPSGFLASEENLLCLIDLWQSVNLKDSDEYLKKSTSKEYFRTTKQRNVNLVNKIDKFMTEQSSQVGFYAVGFLHYAGKQGILSLLEKKGYKITPLDISVCKAKAQLITQSSPQIGRHE